MAKPLTDSQMLQVMDRVKKQGVKTKIAHYWKTNNRNGRGDGWGPIHGVMVHHTASLADSDSYVNWIFRKGHAAVPAPLCHFFITRDGTVWLGSNGRANHAGSGMSWVKDKVIKGLSRDTPEIRPNGRGNEDFNAHFYGFEVAGTGAKPDFTDAQYNAVMVLAGELLKELFGENTTPDMIGHSEATTNKPNDPNYDMREMRRDLDDYLKKSTKPAKQPAPKPPAPKPKPIVGSPVTKIPTQPKETVKMAEITPANFRSVLNEVKYREYVDGNNDGEREDRSLPDIILEMHKMLDGVSAEVLGQEFSEYVDRDGDGVRDKHTVSHILFETHQRVFALEARLEKIEKGLEALLAK